MSGPPRQARSVIRLYENRRGGASTARRTAAAHPQRHGALDGDAGRPDDWRDDERRDVSGRPDLERDLPGTERARKCPRDGRIEDELDEHESRRPADEAPQVVPVTAGQPVDPDCERE